MKFSKLRLPKIAMPSFVCSIYLFLYLPIFILILFSFNDARFVYQWSGFTLDWYYELFRSSEVWIALKNSLIIAFCSSVLSLAMGVLLVWGLFKRSNLLLPFFYITVMIPDVVVAVGLLSFFTLLYVPLGMTTLIVGHTLLGLGFVVPILYTCFNDLDCYLIEASLDLGASMWQTFRRVILPILKPSLMAAGLLVFIISLDDFLIAFFCAASDSQTLSLYIFSMVRLGLSPLINALSVFLLLISCTFVLLFSSLRDKKEFF